VQGPQNELADCVFETPVLALSWHYWLLSIDMSQMLYVQNSKVVIDSCPSLSYSTATLHNVTFSLLETYWKAELVVNIFSDLDCLPIFTLQSGSLLQYLVFLVWQQSFKFLCSYYVSHVLLFLMHLIFQVLEETGFDISKMIDKNEYIESTINDQLVRLYIISGIPHDTKFQPRTRNEIKSIAWFTIAELPSSKKDNTPKFKIGVGPSALFMVMPFIK
jgi:hypothetical protein